MSKINYTNDKEYRQALRDFFAMKCSPTEIIESIDNPDEMDEQTLDELMYDSEAVLNGMNQIYAKTKDIPAFQNLYDVAAALMFSLDRETGIAVLLSYDYFPMFVPMFQNVICEADAVPTTELNAKIESSKEYQTLYSKLTRK